MNKRILRFVQVPLLLGLVALLPGCKKGGETPPPAVQPTAAGGAIVSAEKNSFEEVTSKLDKGGSLYLYLSTEQALSKLSSTINQISNSLSALPIPDERAHEMITKGFDVVNALVKDSGIENISGFGASTIARAPGVYYSKVIMHHYAGKNDGFIWSMFGKEAHPLKELDMLPATTGFASYLDMDVPLVWKTIQTEIARLHIPEADKQMAQVPAQFKDATGISLDDLLRSLGGGYGVILTVDETKTVQLPGNAMQIAEPGLAIFAKVKSDVIFNRVDQALSTSPLSAMVSKADQSGLKCRTVRIPMMPPYISPTLARSGDYLFLTSSEGILQEILAVQAGKKDGFKSTPEFKKLSEGVPMEGNNFSLVSEKLGRIVGKTVQGVLASQTGQMGGQPDYLVNLQNMLATNKGTSVLSVGVNGPEGWEAFANGSQSMSALAPAAGIGGMMAAIAIPNFTRARSTSQENACINNLRLIDAAKQQWALEHHKSNADTPTMEDIKPYLGRGPAGEMPVCPAGGEYIIGSVGEKPRCTISGHELP
jgi:hypothetical protein